MEFDGEFLGTAQFGIDPEGRAPVLSLGYDDLITTLVRLMVVPEDGFALYDEIPPKTALLAARKALDAAGPEEARESNDWWWSTRPLFDFLVERMNWPEVDK